MNLAARLVLIGGILAAALLASACTLEQQALVDAATAQKKAYSDTEAMALKAALCAQTVGAYFRINTQAERNAIAVLCDPNGVPTAPVLTLQEIDALNKALRLLYRNEPVLPTD